MFVLSFIIAIVFYVNQGINLPGNLICEVPNADGSCVGHSQPFDQTVFLHFLAKFFIVWIAFHLAIFFTLRWFSSTLIR